MALRTVFRAIVSSQRRNICISASVLKGEIPDSYDHATGKEKIEMMAHRAGDMDPFLKRLIVQGPGTKEQPTEVPSRYDSRIVGCLCTPDAEGFRYFWLFEHEDQRCHCGHWYRLVPAKPLPTLTYLQDEEAAAAAAK